MASDRLILRVVGVLLAVQCSAFGYAWSQLMEVL